jgi:hypothetical protein
VEAILVPCFPTDTCLRLAYLYSSVLFCLNTLRTRCSRRTFCLSSGSILLSFCVRSRRCSPPWPWMRIVCTIVLLVLITKGRTIPTDISSHPLTLPGRSSTSLLVPSTLAGVITPFPLRIHTDLLLSIRLTTSYHIPSTFTGRSSIRLVNLVRTYRCHHRLPLPLRFHTINPWFSPLTTVMLLPFISAKRSSSNIESDASSDSHAAHSASRTKVRRTKYDQVSSTVRVS